MQISFGGIQSSFLKNKAIVYIWRILIVEIRWMHLIFTYNWLIQKTAFTVHVYIACSSIGWSCLTGYEVFLQKSSFEALLNSVNLIA